MGILVAAVFFLHNFAKLFNLCFNESSKYWEIFRSLTKVNNVEAIKTDSKCLHSKSK